MTVEDSQARVLARPQHTLSRKNVDENALKVLYRLNRSGQKAYLVGGGVRDLLLGRKPKDYDVATDAKPQRVRRLFRNSRIIGRRFRLAHVFFREGIVEVATFRRDPDPETQRGGPGELLITDDNVWGTPRQDAFRRDFTVNALFYDISDYSVIDYVGGIEDLEARQLRAIGDPDVRFQEDPVRMTRACELAGRLGLTIEARTQEGMINQRREIEKASPARLTEEVLQIMRCGRAGRAFQWMVDTSLLEVLIPEAEGLMTAERRGLGRYSEVLAVLDEQAGGENQPSEVGLWSALLLPAVLVRRHKVERGRERPLDRQAYAQLIEETIEPFFARFTLSRLKASQVAQTMLALDRMLTSKWTTVERARFAHKPYFADAHLLLQIAARATGRREELTAWEPAAKQRLPAAPRRRRRPRRRRQRTR